MECVECYQNLTKYKIVPQSYSETNMQPLKRQVSFTVKSSKPNMDTGCINPCTLLCYVHQARFYTEGAVFFQTHIAAETFTTAALLGENCCVYSLLCLLYK